MAELILISLAPAAGGALLYHLARTRPQRVRRAGLAVGQIPLSLRRGRQAIRMEGQA